MLPTRKPRRYQKGRYRIDWDNGISRDLLVSLPLVRGSEFASIGKNGVIGAPSAATTGTTPKGTALKLDGTGYIALGTACLLPSASTPFTLALYELPDATSAFSSLVGLSGGTQHWLWIRGTHANYYCAVSRANYSAVQNFTSVGAQVAGVGHRFLLTSPGGVEGVTGYRLWMDGVEQTSIGTTYGSIASGTNYIGWDSSDTKFNGKLRDFNLWGRILSDAEIEAYFERPDQIYRGRYIPFPESTGGGAPTAALANNLATTASGILVPALALATTGNSATASQGTATPALSLATAGNAATASPGTPVASISLALTGNGATSSVGTVGIGGTTQALAGNAATASAGTPVAQISLALTGNASTASVGTVVPALSKALTGNAATTSAGTPTAAISLALAGNGATASAGTVAVPGVIVPSSNVATASSGTVSPGITVALTGNGATASVGAVSPAISLALSGLAGTSSAGIVVPGLSTALTGNTATSAAGSVSVPTGDITLALSGNAVTATAGSLSIGSEIIRYPSRSRGVTTGRITRSIKPDNFIRSITP